jgi:pimeloyl-ACP methyl ester carboxylesterase
MKKALLIIFVIVLLLPAAIIFLRPDKILAKDEIKSKYAGEHSHFINWRGAEIHYEDEGNGFPVIMIHGYGGSYRNFDKIAALLKDDFRVIRVDLPGFGLSDFPHIDEKNANLGQLYRDYMTFILDTLQLDSVCLMGNSMGGWMAWESAIENPERVKKLVLLCSAGYEMDKVSENAASLMKRGWLMETLFLKGMPEYMSWSGAKKCWYDDSRINPADVQINNDMWNREGNIHAAFLLAGSGQFPDTTRISKVGCPTLIVGGKEDEIIPSNHAYKFQRDIKNSRLVMYEKCGHVPMIENAEQLKQDFLEFIKSI